jgi:hypothetical protein
MDHSSDALVLPLFAVAVLLYCSSQLLRNQEQSRPGPGCQQLQSETELGDLITVGTDDAAGDDSASLSSALQ